MTQTQHTEAERAAAIRECAEIIDSRMRWLMGEVVMTIATKFYQLEHMGNDEWPN